MVIIEAVSLFCFVNGLIKNLDITKSKNDPVIIKILSNATLFTYLMTMHPIIKNHYVEWNIFGFINVNSSIYFILQLLIVCMIICCIGGE